MYCSQQCRDLADAQSYYKRNYGITLQEWDDMFTQQDGLCAICRREGFLIKKCHGTKLLVDHCHVSGAVRGLLCHNCNRGLGLLQDDESVIRRAADYVRNKGFNDRKI